MKSKPIEADDDAALGGNRILIVALFIILLAFFIVLNSIAVVDERRKLEAIGSLVGTFGILPSGLSPFSGKGSSYSPPSAPMQEEGQKHSSPTSPEDDNAMLMKVFGFGLPGAGEVSVHSTVKGRLIRIQDQVVFDQGSYRIRRSSYTFLKKLCDIINQDTYPLEIMGHTDSIPADEKSAESNWEISSLRALEVFKFFVAVGKVDPKRLTAYGCGEYRPIAANEARQTRAQNRRVDVVLDQRSGERLKQIYKKEPSGLFVFKRFVFSIFD